MNTTRARTDKLHITALLLSVILGGFGIDRFYLGYVRTGIIKLAYHLCVWQFFIQPLLDVGWPLTVGLPDTVDPDLGLGLIILFVSVSLTWYVADIVRIATRRLQPKDSPHRKNHATAILVSVFFGWLGFDRFYLDFYVTGLVKLGCFITLVLSLDLLAASETTGEASHIVTSVMVIVAAIVLPVWYILDIIRISTWRLQPKQ